MSGLTSVVRELVQRRLWPIALVLLVALVAAPFVLAKDEEPAAVTSTPASQQASEPASVVALATEGDLPRRRRVLGTAKDPFKPSVKERKEKQATTEDSSGADTTTGSGSTGGLGSTGSGSSGTGGSGSGDSGSGSDDAAEPTPAGALTIRFGDAQGETPERSVLEKGEPLPDDENPALVYEGVDDGMAVFLVDATVSADGDGRCEPDPASCEKVRLKPGETEFFDVKDPTTNAVTAQYQLDIVTIHGAGAKAARASRARTATAAPVHLLELLGRRGKGASTFDAHDVLGR